ncbi:MAG: ankyrin repeat domain-containing protein [Candidatus Dependentiae bacterium]|nr:ankyrin repeat domain-containing protein [Candidatus Dependentiae bacterium]
MKRILYKILVGIVLCLATPSVVAMKPGSCLACKGTAAASTACSALQCTCGNASNNTSHSSSSSSLSSSSSSMVIKSPGNDKKIAPSLIETLLEIECLKSCLPSDEKNAAILDQKKLIRFIDGYCGSNKVEKTSAKAVSKNIKLPSSQTNYCSGDPDDSLLKFIKSSIADESIMEAIIARKANVNKVDTTSHLSVLMEAVRHDGKEKIIDNLIMHGAQPCAKNNNGLAPLMVAASNGKAAYLRKLIEAKADVLDEDGREETALDMAVCKGSFLCVNDLVALLPHNDQAKKVLVRAFDKAAQTFLDKESAFRDKYKADIEGLLKNDKASTHNLKSNDVEQKILQFWNNDVHLPCARFLREKTVGMDSKVAQKFDEVIQIGLQQTIVKRKIQAKMDAIPKEIRESKPEIYNLIEQFKFTPGFLGTDDGPGRKLYLSLFSDDLNENNVEGAIGEALAAHAFSKAKWEIMAFSRKVIDPVEKCEDGGAIIHELDLSVKDPDGKKGIIEVKTLKFNNYVNGNWNTCASLSAQSSKQRRLIKSCSALNGLKHAVCFVGDTQPPTDLLFALDLENKGSEVFWCNDSGTLEKINLNPDHKRDAFPVLNCEKKGRAAGLLHEQLVFPSFMRAALSGASGACVSYTKDRETTTSKDLRLACLVKVLEARVVREKKEGSVLPFPRVSGYSTLFDIVAEYADSENGYTVDVLQAYEASLGVVKQKSSTKLLTQGRAKDHAKLSYQPVHCALSSSSSSTRCPECNVAIGAGAQHLSWCGAGGSSLSHAFPLSQSQRDPNDDGMDLDSDLNSTEHDIHRSGCSGCLGKSSQHANDGRCKRTLSSNSSSSSSSSSPAFVVAERRSPSSYSTASSSLSLSSSSSPSPSLSSFSSSSPLANQPLSTSQSPCFVWEAAREASDWVPGQDSHEFEDK